LSSLEKSSASRVVPRFRRFCLAGALTLATASRIIAQEPAKDSSFFLKGDALKAAAAVVASAGLSLFDLRIAEWSRQPRVQGDSARHDLVKHVTVINEMPLTVGAVLTYGIGRLTGSPTVADVGLHLTESLIATTLFAEVIRVGLGRERPRANPDDQYSFAPGRGLTRFENRAFPSLHASVAFATAATLTEEVRHRNPSATKYAAPLLYGAAMIPGLTRVYLDQHWASDVLAGTLVGAFIGSRVVQYTHGRRTRLDRFLLGGQARIIPTGEDVLVVVALPGR
jgi:membrane-associated phospholipid phosphatase